MDKHDQYLILKFENLTEEEAKKMAEEVRDIVKKIAPDASYEAHQWESVLKDEEVHNV